ncbi:bifunctional mannosyl-3-phosphoglycerate synthase/mannosyl-3 phosphoglycerate phosphatase [Dehalogenimonas alkenigignens]|uniref:Mannosyl-3-phosphoglycerate phosphatase n=1 Tax=Dehalogenimonas alkenigignens TaxID=1217799 RepID=A0A0W0GIQ8_9CHLR|nr:bifunctional mannosyl-3-phosphoglycerate synthase/mannosyl-3 phosphoglycerate phosphatase [Dehalogenimonas alkenigignens]KTB48419.1 mannosyl-3-phosphoglycerate synthase/mannosyl-3-phosphoglycerate phosphatase [Dehalogenimonas alkenigignens]PVV85126.1 mannosyl-3-phosphoglycerate synthase [Dehalogenimonas alkenigignens]
MRLERTRQTEHMGSISLYGVRRVLELDSGVKNPQINEAAEVQKIERESIDEIEKKLAIVLPIKNEDLKVFEGVLSAIPHDSFIIVLSNSQRGEIDTFRIEHEILNRFCQVTRRQAMIVHQKDPSVARALADAGYHHILGDDKLIRNGKSEGMILGILLAKLLGKEYIGFIDTDNYIPGSALEYVKHYAAAFSLAKSPYAMTRIQWRYKPKIMGELYFKKWGRVSEITNKHLNNLVSAMGRFETEVIKTGNAGEHAMSVALADRLTYGTGYAVETQELISIFELFSGLLPITDKEVSEKGVEVFQTETVNPHLHADKGDEHVVLEMMLPSLSVIYHSPLCQEKTKKAILTELVEAGIIKPDEEPTKVRLMPPPQKADLSKFSASLSQEYPRLFVPEGQPLPIIGGRGPNVAARLVVFSDLDGTLLHPTSYSYAPALTTLRRLQARDIPIVFCSSKTREEQVALRQELGITDPFIVENGSAVFIPKSYFRLPFSYDRVCDDYLVIEMGVPYQELKLKLNHVIENVKARLTKNAWMGTLDIACFGDLTVEDIARETGLGLKAAEAAKHREYTETMKLHGGRQAIEFLLAELKKAGLSHAFGGRFYTVSGGNEKGKAVKLLTELFKLNYGAVITTGVGDSDNDVSMLAAVDRPVLVQNQSLRWAKVKLANLVFAKGVGPEGWSRALADLAT